MINPTWPDRPTQSSPSFARRPSTRWLFRGQSSPLWVLVGGLASGWLAHASGHNLLTVLSVVVVLWAVWILGRCLRHARRAYAMIHHDQTPIRWTVSHRQAWLARHGLGHEAVLRACEASSVGLLCGDLLRLELVSVQSHVARRKAYHARLASPAYFS